jgi:hypothetical protein
MLIKTYISRVINLVSIRSLGVFPVGLQTDKTEFYSMSGL